MTTSPHKEKPVHEDHTARPQPLTDGLYIAVAVFVSALALLFIYTLVAPAPARSAEPPPFPHIGSGWAAKLLADEDLQAENRRLRVKLRKEHRANVHHARIVRRQRAELRNVYEPVTYALRLASASFGVPLRELRAVGNCESHLWPFASNRKYRGLFQEGPMFEAGPFGHAGFSVWDPIANAMTAAYTVAREGWSQWECKP